MKKNHKKLLRVTLGTVLCLTFMLTKHAMAAMLPLKMRDKEQRRLKRLEQRRLRRLELSGQLSNQIQQLSNQIQQLSNQIQPLSNRIKNLAQQYPLSTFVEINRVRRKAFAEQKVLIEEQLQKIHQRKDQSLRQNSQLISLNNDLNQLNINLNHITQLRQSKNRLESITELTKFMKIVQRQQMDLEVKVKELKQNAEQKLYEQRKRVRDIFFSNIKKIKLQTLQDKKKRLQKLTKIDQERLFKQRTSKLLLRQQTTQLKLKKKELEIELKKMKFKGSEGGRII